ncbi:MAG TPA: MerR family transcriptional regulator [Halomonas sp.]|jgi:DNA-binding transcriptional MerR regulator|nr:MerR family transcriptional regulator [Halomonas meridiana]MBV64809.1 MerR family transcriptional regulator [Halomonas sp.]HAY17341.1 MerR family transcriptional regulator [Halomonas sp.]HBQ05489.1 MerR family transcriptional regulator [Halomonas sp.]HBS18435.1 MerR family transcriptional regulator [Halomonas sp.]|tara:strand:- start:65 stop:994 length:930 start_codon:yes stop_codon:yes gene_type:complete
MAPMSNKATHPPDTPLYPIREVSRLTGVNSVTLRAWERRYGLIRPQRTPKGHRLYAQDDISRIERILQWLNRGVPVSQVADLLDQPETVEAPAPDAGDWSSQRQQLLAVIEAVDLPKLEALYHQSLALYPLSVAINELWQPVILTLEAKWAAQPDDLVRRTFEAFLRSQVGTRLHYANQATRGPLILLSAMPDDPGPLWVLMSALMASEQGYRVQLFDHSLALEDLAQAVSRLHSSMVLLSSGQRECDNYIRVALPKAAEALGVPIGVCGEVARLRENDLRDGPVHMLGDDLPQAIARLRPLLRESGIL